MAEELIYKVRLDGTQEQLQNLALLQDAINQLSQQKKKLNAEEKALNEEIKKGNLTAAEAEQKQIALAQKQVQLSLTTKQTKDEFRQAEKALMDNTKAVQTNEGSIEQLRVELRQSQQAYIKLSKAERENEKIGGVLQKRIAAQDQELKKLEKDIGITSRSVGDYGQAVQGVLPMMGNFGSQAQMILMQLGGMKKALMTMAGGMKASASATGGTSKALKVFRMALISTGIGAIVVALGSLVAGFLSTQKGMDAVNKVLRPLSEVFQTLFGYIQDVALGVFDRLKAAIDNPKQAFIDLGNLIKNNFINRMTGAVDTIKAAGRLIVASFKSLGLGVKKVLADVPLIGGKIIDKEQLEKDLEETRKEIIDASKDLGESLLQTATGVEDLPSKIANTFNAAAEGTKEAIKRGQEIDKLTKEIEQAEINLNREREKANRTFQEQKQLAQNTLLTDQERLKASRNAQAALQRIRDLDVDQLNRKIKLTELQQMANDTDREGQKELQDLIAERERAEADAISKNTELSNMANGIRKAAIKAEEKAIEDRKKKEEEAFKEKVKQLNELKVATEDINAELIINEEDKEKRLEELRYERELAEIEASIKLADNDEQITEALNKKKEALRKQHEQNISNIAIAEMEKRNETELLELEKSLLNQGASELEIEKSLTEKRMELLKSEIEKKRELGIEAGEQELELLKMQNDKKIEEEKRKEDRKKEIQDATFQAAEAASDIYFQNQGLRIERDKDRELDALTAKLESGLITEEEYQKKRKEVERNAFERKKRTDIAQALINGAVSVTQTFAQLGWPAGILGALIVAAQTATQVAAIKAQKFSKGGWIKGASHEQGGVPFTVDGVGGFEAEGGEVIINKKSASMFPETLSAINEAGGGVKLAKGGRLAKPSIAMFRNGGALSSGASQMLDTGQLRSDIISGVTQSLGALKVVNNASETAEVAGRVIEIEQNATF
jgi:hypothetical protein